jgi:hypothetical protein
MQSLTVKQYCTYIYRWVLKGKGERLLPDVGGFSRSLQEKVKTSLKQAITASLTSSLQFIIHI